MRHLTWTRSFLALLCTATVGCDTLSSGRKYTLAKIARDGSLIEPHRKLARGTDQLDAVPKKLSIVLNSGFIRYLEAIERPEVAIFARVKVRKPTEFEESLVWEKVYLMSEDANEQMVLNKDTFLPRKNIPLLPGINYDGKDEIYVSLRIIELDQADNERVRSLVNSAASATAAVDPEIAVGASVFQTVLTFLTKNNPDDIEFQFDFALIPNSDDATIKLGTEERYMVLPPRIGQYVVIKTEHQHRLVYPSDYFDMFHHSFRYFLGNALKVATLGVCNWTVWDSWGADPADDFYMKIMGRPFATDGAAWRLPEFTDQSLEIGADGGDLRMLGDTLIRKDAGAEKTFIDQGYLTISIIETKTGLDLEALRAANKAKESINRIVSTGQLSIEQFRAAVDELGKGIIEHKVKEQLESQLETDLDSATTPKDVEAALERVRGRMEELDIGDAQSGLLAELRAKAEDAHRKVGGGGDLGGSRLDRELVILTDKTGVLNLIHPKGANIEIVPGDSDREPKSVEITRSSSRDLRSFSTVTIELGTIPKVPTKFELKLLIDDRLVRLHYWIVPPLDIEDRRARKQGTEEWDPWNTNDNPWRAGKLLRLTPKGAVEGEPILTWLKERGVEPHVELRGKTVPSSVDGAGLLVLKNESNARADPNRLKIKLVVALDGSSKE